MSTSQSTTDHEIIRRWIEERDGRPALVRDTVDGQGNGVLRVDFDGADDQLEQVDWDHFFAVFDRSKVAFLHQDKTADGGLSRFNKFIDQDGSR